MDAVETEANLLPLRPFTHQVGGHSSFQQFDKHTVCKPLFSKELKFYLDMPLALKPFIPQFKGVVNAQWKEDYEGKPSLVADPNSPAYCASDVPKNLSDYDDDLHNSWDWKYEKNHFPGLHSSGHSFRQFLILENVISHYHCPSILDLKMGTQIHSDSKTSEEEMRRRRSKWEKTTARTLGVRLGGMKVYRVDYGKFFFMNNNDGRQLNDQGFEEALRMFFDNGETFRCELICSFVQKLTTFLDVMEKEVCAYRFYNSSLLLVYESETTMTTGFSCKTCSTNSSEPSSPTHQVPSQPCTCVCESTANIDIRLIDFAHVSRDDDCLSQPDCTSCTDEGFIFGLQSLIRIMRNIQDNYHRKKKLK